MNRLSTRRLTLVRSEQGHQTALKLICVFQPDAFISKPRAPPAAEDMREDKQLLEEAGDLSYKIPKMLG